MIKHPEQLGFKLGLRIRICEPASITEDTRAASEVRDVVYVALAESDGPLEKGDALKIGQTGGTLSARWRSMARIFRRGESLRPNEREDRRRWLEAADGNEVFVWMKAAGKIEIPYAKGLTRSLFSTRGAEEEFLDQYYQPKLGRQLNRKATEQTD